MADQNEEHTPDTQQPEIEQAETAKPEKGLDALIQKLPLPPKYRTRKWVLSGAGMLLALVVIWFQCNSVGGSNNSVAEPPPVAAATTTPEPTPIPREEYQLPRQYAFVHFVNEMAACYDQNGQAATLETVEADIMHDVPDAVGTLMRLYADNQCEEVEPWHQIPGRAGWMLRASGVDEHLPQPEPEEEEPK